MGRDPMTTNEIEALVAEPGIVVPLDVRLATALTAEHAARVDAEAGLEKLTGWPTDMPKCRHGIGIFGDRIKCEHCDGENALTARAEAAKAQLLRLRRIEAAARGLTFCPMLTNTRDSSEAYTAVTGPVDELLAALAEEA